jgi:peptidoglycan/xylan/chitin deacetylase (PgdA/CDA1 family)
MSLTGLAKTKLANLSARMLKERPACLAGRKPVASITFDRFPKSAWTEGGPVLARHGVQGTYYAAGGLCGRTMDGTVFYDEGDLKALAAAGHEIGCHGFGHEPTPMLTTDELSADSDRNRDFLKPFLNGKAPLSYAYPFGQISPHTKRFHAPRFACLRGVHSGINAGRVDLAQLNAISLERRYWDEEKVQTAIQRALHDDGWLIFHTHDVSDAPSEYGSTPAMLDWTLSRLKEARIPVLPVREALPVALGTQRLRPDTRQGGGGRDAFGVELHMDDGREA